MTDCINNGNLVSTGGARCGGLLSLANHATNSFCGCANYGEILTDDANRGVFFGYSAYATSWINCIAGGKVGVYNGGTRFTIRTAKTSRCVIWACRNLPIRSTRTTLPT